MRKAVAKDIKDLIRVLPNKNSKDIDCYISIDEMTIKTEDVNNSFDRYTIGIVRNNFKLIIIRKYIFGHVYIWKML